jgi:hypothetical protein
MPARFQGLAVEPHGLLRVAERLADLPQGQQDFDVIVRILRQEAGGLGQIGKRSIRLIEPAVDLTDVVQGQTLDIPMLAGLRQL